MLPARAAKIRAKQAMQNRQLPPHYLILDSWKERKEKETPFDPRITTMDLLLSKRKDKIKQIKEAGGTLKAEIITEEYSFWTPIYEPRAHRTVRLSRDLAKGRESHQVPMYCDLKARDKATVRDPLKFTYIVRNEILNADLGEETLVKQCDCTGDCDENCACFQFGIHMNNGQVEFIDGSLRITNPHTDICKHVLIVCGPLCKCASTCPRRIENMMKKFKFEVFRRNPAAGFGVRTLSHIVFGELVMEFVGEVIPEEEILQREYAEDYALEFWNGQEKALIKRAKDLIPSTLPAPYPTEMIHIDCSLRGNVSRFILNGCWPSLQLIRVIENYIDPRRHRLFLYATHDIPAGMELTFFYGEDYLKSTKRQFECVCKTLLCEKGRWMKRLKDIHPTQVKKAILKIHQIWREIVEEGRRLEALDEEEDDEEDLGHSADEEIVLSSDDDGSQEDSDSEIHGVGDVVGRKEEEDISGDGRYRSGADLHLQDESESDSDEEGGERIEDQYKDTSEDGDELRDQNEERAELRQSYEMDSDSNGDDQQVGDVNHGCEDSSAVVAEQPLQHGGDVLQEEAALQPEEELMEEEVVSHCEDHLQDGEEEKDLDEEYSEFLETGRTIAPWLREKERKARERRRESLKGVHQNRIGDEYEQWENSDHWRGGRIIVHSLPRTEERELIEYEGRRAAAAAEAERLKADAAARKAERVRRDTVAAAAEEEPHPLSSRGRFKDLAKNMFRCCHGERFQGQSSSEYDRPSSLVDNITGRKRTREEAVDDQRRQGGQLHVEQRGRYGSVNSGGSFRDDHHRHNDEYDQRQMMPFPDPRHSSRDIPMVTLSNDEEECPSLQNISREDYGLAPDEELPLPQWSPCPYLPTSPEYPSSEDEEMPENQLLQSHGDQDRRREGHEDRRWNEGRSAVVIQRNQYQLQNEQGGCEWENELHGRSLRVTQVAQGVHYQRQVERERREDRQWNERENMWYGGTQEVHHQDEGSRYEMENPRFQSHGVQRHRRDERVRFEDCRWDERERQLRGRSVIETQGVHLHRRHEGGRWEDRQRDERDHRRYNESYTRQTMDYEFRCSSSNYDRNSSRREQSRRDCGLQDDRQPYQPHSPEILRDPSPEPWETFHSHSSDWRQNASFNTGYPRNGGYGSHGDGQNQRRDERRRLHEDHYRPGRYHGSYNEGRRMDYY